MESAKTQCDTYICPEPFLGGGLLIGGGGGNGSCMGGVGEVCVEEQVADGRASPGVA